MATSNARWKCFLLMFTFISASSAFPQRATDFSAYEDSIQQGLNISNDHQLEYISRDNEYDFQIFDILRNIVEKLTDRQEDDRSRLLFGCSSDVKNTLSVCLDRCPDVSCQLQELTNYMSACSSDTKQTCTTTTTPTATDPPVTTTCPTHENYDQCGVANNGSTNQSSDATRILGGVEVNPPLKYPWMVGLVHETETKNRSICGGSIINNRWILTAAHWCIIDNRCLTQPWIDGLQVRVGEHNEFTTDDDDPVHTKDYTVRRFVIHPHVECPGTNNDFALLELTSEIHFNNVIKPICLPEDDTETYAGVAATVTGWGINYLQFDENGTAVFESPGTLMELDVTIINQSDCSGIGTFEDTKLCTEFIPDNSNVSIPFKGACIKDQGGPLVVKKENKYIQVGLVSGYFECPLTIYFNSPEYSVIYARVSKVLDWIMETTASGLYSKC